MLSGGLIFCQGESVQSTHGLSGKKPIWEYNQLLLSRQTTDLTWRILPKRPEKA
jgi:hypothetical protein